eukprot:130834-Amphidinium_carterae.1
MDCIAVGPWGNPQSDWLCSHSMLQLLKCIGSDYRTLVESPYSAASEMCELSSARLGMLHLSCV